MICIQPSTGNHVHSLQIYHYGYGGKSQVELGDDLSVHTHTVERYLTVKNKGDIEGFAILISNL